jgi:hypothetical protein
MRKEMTNDEWTGKPDCTGGQASRRSDVEIVAKGIPGIPGLFYGISNFCTNSYMKINLAPYGFKSSKNAALQLVQITCFKHFANPNLV